MSDLKTLIFDNLEENYNFTEEQKIEICIFLVKHPKVLKMLMKNNWLISIEDAIRAVYADDKKYSYLKDFDCSPFFSCDIKDNDNYVRDVITWVIMGWLLKDFLKNSNSNDVKAKPRLKPKF